MMVVDIDTARVIISAPTKQLLEVLQFLKRALPRGKKAFGAMCELTVKTNQIDFVVIGASKTLYCRANGPVKVSVVFDTFHDLVKNTRTYHTLILIADEFLRIGVTTINARTCFFTDDSILRSINLPINYNARDVLRMAGQYTREEIEFNDLTETYSQTMNGLLRDMTVVYERLRKYGFTRKEVENLMLNKIYV